MVFHTYRCLVPLNVVDYDSIFTHYLKLHLVDVLIYCDSVVTLRNTCKSNKKMLKYFNILFYFNETLWQGTMRTPTCLIYYYNEELGSIINFYLINWFNEFMKETKNETVRVVVR